VFDAAWRASESVNLFTLVRYRHPGD